MCGCRSRRNVAASRRPCPESPSPCTNITVAVCAVVAGTVRNSSAGAEEDMVLDAGGDGGGDEDGEEEGPQSVRR